jgi:PAS domain S-box-containing protein
MDLSDYVLERLREDAEFILFRAKPTPGRPPILIVATHARPGEESKGTRLAHELDLFKELEPDWALKPLSLMHDEGRTWLALRDPGGQPLDISLAGRPLELMRFLEIAIGITAAVRQLHASGLIHKDIRPANIFIDGRKVIRLTGFGFASRLPRERQASSSTESMEGTLGYMAPEQTGRVNRSVDNRSDLYSLGMTLYEMLAGVLPFAASDAIEWIHSHIARQPPPPSLRVEGVPKQIDSIILKLLAKNAEDRYQTAAGLEHDLRRSLRELQDSRTLAPFPLAKHDEPDRLLVPEKLYGREDAIAALGVAYKRAALGSFQIVLVSGYSGVGKSSAVNALLQSMRGNHGLTAVGKVDQYKRDIPYSTLAEAFQDLLRHILSQDDSELQRWRLALTHAMGINSRLMSDLFPDLGLILGDQPPAPIVPEQEAKTRLHEVFRRYLSVFAQREHPFALFIDDLQWLDVATLDLLRWLIVEGGVPHFLLIGAYRSNEVDSSPGLAKLLSTINAAETVGAPTAVNLSALSIDHVTSLVAEALRAKPETVLSLAELVFKKTQGNPFFVVQFLSTLNAEGLLTFHSTEGAWRWDLERIASKGITDNVAELLTTKLGRFQDSDLTLIKQFACLGNTAATTTLRRVLGVSEADVVTRLRPFVSADLIHKFEQRYSFAHDRVQEAAYALIPEFSRAQAHLQLGRALVSSFEEDSPEEGVFEVVNQLNHGVALIESPTERQQLAELNLTAGKRAKAAVAYESALRYLQIGINCLPADCWEESYRTTFELMFHRAECKFLIGDVIAAERDFSQLSTRCTTLSDLALVVGRQLTLYPYLGRADRAVELCLDCLAKMGVDIPLQPSAQRVEEEYLRLLERVGEGNIGSLLDLPVMRSTQWLVVMDLLRGLTGPAGLVNGDLLNLICVRMMEISLDHGHSDEVTVAYAQIGGLLCGWKVGSYEVGREFGELALSLTVRGLDRFAARVYQVVGALIRPYYLPLRQCDALLVRATEVSIERGGVVFAGYGWASQVGQMIDSGTALGVILKRTEEGLEFATSRQFALAIEFLKPQRLMVRALRGLNARLSFEDEDFAEEAYERHLESAPHFLHAKVRYFIRKLQLAYYAGDYVRCMQAISKLAGHKSATPFWESIAEYPFFSALARAASLGDSGSPDWDSHLAEIKSSHSFLSEWIRRCPDNFSDRAALVEAEIARLEGRELEAERLYETAIRLSRKQGFLQNEALGNELAARFYADRDFEFIATAYWRNARACYLRWGADGKVRQLDEEHPRIGEAESNTVRAARDVSLQRLDLAAVVEMHQAVSQEIVLDRLIQRLMTIATEYAGAVRGLLLLHRDGALGIVAEASTDDQAVTINLRPQFKLAGRLPQSILNYVVHSQEVVIIGDALESHSSDEYVREAQPRAILCIPLVKQSHLVGVLYLENNLSAHIFTKDRLLVLQLLVSQAAISIENAELFSSVREAQEASRRVSGELRQSFDTMPALAWRASAAGLLEFSNQQWHDYTGVPAEGTQSSSWVQCFHPDDTPKVVDKWRYLLEFRTSGEFEARMRRYDGEFRSFLIRVTPMRDERGTVLKWHGTHTDIENLKRAEHAQEALARVTRVTAMGELTVSIAHEINQPLMAIVTNAATCLRWLNDQQLNIGEARMAAERIIRDGHRAGEVIASIRAMAKKSPPKPAELDLNELIAEVLSLTRNELNRHEITTETDLAPDAESVLGDRIQLQQVMLNIIINGVEAISAASHEWRSLKIRSKKEEPGFILVTVADTGIGLTTADSDRLFDVFYTTKPDGMGIGLSICRSIIESHGGRLWALPNQPVGTVFHITLPAFAEERVH